MPPHISVLLEECMKALLPDGRTIVRAIDGTLGAGGHTEALLQGGAEHVLAFDVDIQAIAIAQERLSSFGERLTIVHDSYVNMRQHAITQGWQDGVDAILLDVGASSMQFDTPERGFAFMHEAPLDMRFNPQSNEPTASDIINTWHTDDLADIFWRYGEEKQSRRLARAIVQARPITTTTQLADVIAKAMPPPRNKRKQTSNIHPATRVFQALRIAVNDELGAIERVLPIAIDLLCSGGRLAVISFHSLEDRLVKKAFKDASTTITAPPGMASMPTQEASVELVTRKPIIATEEEIASNPRSRSAKLRVVEKL
jgi:16S rRNA (cytosine1402-N4)-methyltransferase